MGVAKDLETAKKELEKVKELVDKSKISDAQKAVGDVEKLLNKIVADFNAKMSRNMLSIQKLDTAVEALNALMKKVPFDGPKANDLIKQATTAAAGAVSGVKTD